MDNIRKMKMKITRKNIPLPIRLFGIDKCPNCDSKNLTLTRLKIQEIKYKRFAYIHPEEGKKEYFKCDSIDHHTIPEAAIICRDCGWKEEIGKFFRDIIEFYRGGNEQKNIP